MLHGESILGTVFRYRREIFNILTFVLYTKHIRYITPFNCRLKIVLYAHTKGMHVFWNQGGWSTDHNLSTHFLKQQYIRQGHAAMDYITDYGNLCPFQCTYCFANGKSIK